MTEIPLRLAIITQNPACAQSLEQLANTYGWAVTPLIEETVPLEWISNQQIDLLLVDLELPNVIPMLMNLSSRFPEMRIMAVAAPQHLAKLQEAMLAGAKDFVAYPFDPTFFQATVQRVLRPQTGLALASSHVTSTKGRVVAVASLRGGVGRSTIAVNLAATLRKSINGDVILTEAHHSLGHLALMLNLHPRHTLADLAEETEIDSDIIRSMLQQHANGIRLLAAAPLLSQLADLSGEAWRLILQTLSQMAPYVVVDTSSMPDAALPEVLTLADDIIIVASPDIPGLRGVHGLMEALEMEQDVSAHIHLVLNRSDVPGGLDENAIQKQLRKKIIVRIPDDPSLATFALNRGVPFVFSHPRAILSRRIDMLAEHLMNHQVALNGQSKTRPALLSMLSIK